VWLGIDDTDSRDGMCTTHLAGDLIVALNENGLDIIGYPRLVRLNPNIPWKTRGNGAIAIHFGIGKGKRQVIGKVNGTRYGYHNLHEPGPIPDLFEHLVDIVRNRAMVNSEGTNPGVVVTHQRPPESLYLQAVRHIVSQEQAKKVLEDIGARYCGMNTGRGLIGATAAIAWRPVDRTFESITYRNGGPRWVDETSVQRMDRRLPATFDNYDYPNQHIQIMPASPCPVLYGIRGENPEEVTAAMDKIVSSSVRRWVLFETNQGTDAHLQEVSVADIKSYMSVIVTGTVDTMPSTIQGGHVLFDLADTTGTITCAAYEPTKQFRDIVRCLYQGDMVTVCGGVRGESQTINIEKMQIHHLMQVREKIENPVCPTCQKHMKSIGRNKGFRCCICRQQADETAAIWKCVPRQLSLGWYEVPVVARRHLAKPLKRMHNTTSMFS